MALTRSMEIILEWISEEYARKVWIGCIWLRIRTTGGVL
jgi:hypothetical protein